MYINDVSIVYYIIVAILGLFIGELVNWANKRLPDYKKVFSIDLFKEYKHNFSPNYSLMILLSRFLTGFADRLLRLHLSWRAQQHTHDHTFSNQ